MKYITMHEVLRKKIPLLFCIVLLLLNTSCEKYLDKKPDQKLAIPETLEDAQALMDNYSLFNSTYPSIGDQSDDNFYLIPTYYNLLTQLVRDYYGWAQVINYDVPYMNIYRIVLNANIAMETIDKLPKTPANEVQWNTVKGTALFFKSYALYQAAEYYAEPYDSALAEKKPGVPLRPVSDAAVITTRATMAETWNQIVAGYAEAASLLPFTTQLPSRPTKQAAYAALARVYLAMGKYALAAEAAGKSLAIYAQLIDFNTINPAASAPFTLFNKEVVFHATSQLSSQLTLNVYSLDTILYNSYAVNDLRKTIYFRTNAPNRYGFKANLGGNPNGGPFSGIAVDEVYLIYAEGLARTGKITQAMDALNTLLITRWKTGTFLPYTANTAEEALQVILKERRKELILRGTRWFDLRRLNKNSATATVPERNINGNSILLPVNSKRYVFTFPLAVIEVSGIEQNLR